MNQLLFVFLILFAIALHEFGHFITAKRFGMKVDRFFIGFGPKIWSVKRGETEYGFNWIPAGGYVRIAGMNPFEEIAPEDQDRVFKAKKPWQRAIVLAAGSTMHFILAFVVLAGLLMTAGAPDGPITTTVSIVDTGTPAYAAGFEEGDTIVAVAGTRTNDWEVVRDYIRAHPGEKVAFTVVRNGKEVTLSPMLASKNKDNENLGFLGVSPSTSSIKRGPGKAVVEAGKGLGLGIKESFTNMGKIVAPSTFKRLFLIATGKEKREATDPTSIVGITRAAGQSGIVNLLLMFIGFNIFIGVANLMPLPPLDGGHLAVLAYEKIRGRSVDMRKLIPITLTVIVVMISLFVLATFADIVQPPVPG